MYDDIAARIGGRRAASPGDKKNTHPLTRRTYLLRSMVVCGCGRRMYGCRRHDDSYYLCKPDRNNKKRPDGYPDHTLYVREENILDAVTRFFGDRVFGPDRRAILAADLGSVDDHAARERQAERDRLERTLASVTRRQATVLRQAQDGDPDDPFTKALRGTYNELEADKTTTLAAITAIDSAAETEAPQPSTTDIDLLDALP
jgi:hypothetical protein